MDGEAAAVSHLAVKRDGLFVERSRLVRLPLRAMQLAHAVERSGELALIPQLARESERGLEMPPCRDPLPMCQAHIPKQAQRLGNSGRVLDLPRDRQAFLHIYLC